MRNSLGMGLLAVVAAGLAQPVAAQRGRGEEQLARELAGRVAGPPVDCLPPGGAQGSRIIDRTAIVFEVGGRLYVNRPQSGANWLDRDDILVVRPHGDALCRSDSVELLDRASRAPAGFVILDRFVPYSRPRPRR